MHESQLLPLVIVLLPREASAQRRGGCDDSVALHGVVEKTAHCYECTWRRSDVCPGAAAASGTSSLNGTIMVCTARCLLSMGCKEDEQMLVTMEPNPLDDSQGLGRSRCDVRRTNVAFRQAAPALWAKEPPLRRQPDLGRYRSRASCAMEETRASGSAPNLLPCRPDATRLLHSTASTLTSGRPGRLLCRPATAYSRTRPRSSSGRAMGPACSRVWTKSGTIRV